MSLPAGYTTFDPHSIYGYESPPIEPRPAGQAQPSPDPVLVLGTAAILLAGILYVHSKMEF